MARERGDTGVKHKGMDVQARKEMMNRVFDAARLKAKSKGKRRKPR